MTCYLHQDLAAVSFCRACGRGLCAECQRFSEGTIYCQEHAPMTQYSNTPGAGAPPPVGGVPPNPYQQPYVASQSTSPGLAFLLGLIPGVGAIYNGQYLKGLAHVAVFGFLITIVENLHGDGPAPLFGMLIGCWYFYMAFEAYHTAKKRQLGIPVDEWSSLFPRRNSPSNQMIGPILLIVLGVFFLLDQLNLLRLRDVMRFWPVALIALGAYLLYARLSDPGNHSPLNPPPADPSGIAEAHRDQ